MMRTSSMSRSAANRSAQPGWSPGKRPSPRRQQTTAGTLFEFTCNRKAYLATNHHRGQATTHKSTWQATFTRDEEFLLFDTADYEEWTVGQGYYGILNGAHAPIGSDGQHVAYFPETQNASDPWHGFPMAVNPSRDDVVPDILIDRWVAEDVIGFAAGERLRRGKL